MHTILEITYCSCVPNHPEVMTTWRRVVPEPWQAGTDVIHPAKEPRFWRMVQRFNTFKPAWQYE